MPHRPELDGLRGVAILLVLCHHALDWPRGGFLGVDLFFVLSGYLITRVLEQGITLRKFYWRRLLRLAPALVALIAITLALGWQTFDRQLLGALTYSLNLMVASGHAGVGSPLGICWSLSVEEQFYLLWPFLFRRVGPRGLIGLIALGVLWRWALLAQGVPCGRLYYGTDTRCEGLLFGCLAAKMPLKLPALLPLAGLAVLAAGPRDFWLYAGGLTLVNLAFAGSLQPTGWLKQALCLPVLRFFGKLSYGLYLWHWAFVVHMPRYAIPLSILAACASYLLVERPFLRLKDAT